MRVRAETVMGLSSLITRNALTPIYFGLYQMKSYDKTLTNPL